MLDIKELIPDWHQCLHWDHRFTPRWSTSSERAASWPWPELQQPRANEARSTSTLPSWTMTTLLLSRKCDHSTWPPDSNTFQESVQCPQHHAANPHRPSVRNGAFLTSSENSLLPRSSLSSWVSLCIDLEQSRKYLRWNFYWQNVGWSLFR